ncbi:DNA cytosine methyltransferase [Aquimarina intermedia]|uniref:Cytosine-specific methyltransferase n=1 Tax=Aquimarina intermedia TaxID=350814 RepID=A0A5S5BYT0_9FLAO|nr:DNA (cytosine-5-)-methyltransferase [Aquimarina intermedia]TYP71508.1 DNA (cytosine-5)-methyltransferase 1 [Aquimarina intermedia]
MIRHATFFSGIGGPEIAAEWMGWKNLMHCEINPFGRKILEYYWPKAKSYEDITKTDFTIHRGKIDVLTGGFPCQPFSTAGKREGTEDNRHLWPEMLRGIREIQPRWVVGENVYGLINWSKGLVFEQIQIDLENEGYQVIPVTLPAASVDAPHKRERIFFIAYAGKQRCDHGCDNWEERCFQNDIKRNSQKDKSERKQFQSRTCKIGEDRNVTNTNNEGLQIARFKSGKQKENEELRTKQCSNKSFTPNPKSESSRGELQQQQEKRKFRGQDCGAYSNTTSIRGNQSNWKRESRFLNEKGQVINWENFPTQSPICGRDDGLPSGLDGITFSKWRNQSIQAYGNAIVPQVIYQIYQVIDQMIKEFNY